MQSDSSKAYENAMAEYERLSGQPAFIRLIRRKKLDEAETDMREKHNVWVSEEVSALANAWTPERLPPYRMMAELDARFGTDRGTVETLLRREYDRSYPLSSFHWPMSRVRSILPAALRACEESYESVRQAGLLTQEVLDAVDQWRKSDGPTSDFRRLEALPPSSKVFAKLPSGLRVWHRMPLSRPNSFFPEDSRCRAMSGHVLSLRQGDSFSLMHPLSTSPIADWWGAGTPADLSLDEPDKGSGILWEMVVLTGLVWPTDAYLNYGARHADSLEVIIPAQTTWIVDGWRDIIYTKEMTGFRKLSPAPDVRFRTLMVHQVGFTRINVIDDDPAPVI